MKYKAILITAIAASLFLVGCGGGGGSGAADSNDVFKSFKASVFSGGQVDVSQQISDDFPSTGFGCGYSEPFTDKTTVENKLLRLGGSVTKSTPTQWCGTVSGETSCMSQFGSIFVSDSSSWQGRSTELHLTGLLADHITSITLDTTRTKPAAEMVTSIRDAYRVNSNACPAETKQLAAAINGRWTGYKATYFPSTTTAITVASTVLCVNQTCTLSDAPEMPIVLTQTFGDAGNWSTATNATVLAGATISVDKLLLSMFACNTPLTESRTFESCSFYTFKR